MKELSQVRNGRIAWYFGADISHLEKSLNQNKRKINWKNMKVLLTTPAVYPVPPSSYGGLEQIVWNLAKGLSSKGIFIELAAPYGSATPPGGHTTLTCPPNSSNPEQVAYQVVKTNNDWLDQFDIIHDHSWQKWIYIHKSENPKSRYKLCSTLHGMNPYGSKPPVRYMNLICISQFHSLQTSGALGIPTRFVYNGIDLDQYKYQKEKGERFLFLSRINKYKGVHEAINICKRLGLYLDVVGEDVFVEDHRYVLDIINSCDGKLIKYWGRVSNEKKLEFLKNAKAIIIPLLPPWQEPFGMMTIEALACGTPVITTNNGAMAEQIITGENGFLCGDLGAIELAIKRIDEISPEKCYESSRRFGIEQMTEGYMQLYKELLEGKEW